MPQKKTLIHSFADSLTEFRHWLEKEGLSKKTVKNYVSDVNLWIEWSASQEDTNQNTLFNAENYKTALEENGTPTSTLHRHLASLRRYSEFISQNHPQWPSLIVPENTDAPIKHEVAKKKILQHFALALQAENCKETSVKNYLTDIKLFGDSLPEHSFDEIFRKPVIAWYLAEQRKQGLTQNTLRRKEASFKRFGAWAQKEEFISQNPYETWIEKKKQQLVDTFTPLALFEKRKTTASKPSAPVTESTPASSSAVRHQLLGWYEHYHSWKLSSYLHLGILVIFAVMIGLFGYQQFYVNVQQQFAYPSTPTRPGRILSFQGRLTDSGRTPITTPINFEFRLYNDESAGTELWNSSTCSIDPDQDGIFSTLLGDSVNGCGTEITENVFTENDEVWLEVQVSSETLTPRQRIATVPYALNSETVQGFPVSLSGGINTIPVINALGEIIIGANNPSLIASSGAFLIQGESLLFQTETGTNGDISFQPDGEGSVQILSSTSTSDSLFISNSNLTTGNLIRGEVGNNSTTFNLLSLASGSTPDTKFVVDALGNTTIDGYLTAPGATISSTYSGNTPLTVNGTGGQILTLSNGGQLSLATTGSSGGLVLGGDTNLYRSSANLLRTDDSFFVGNDVTITNNLQATIIALGGISPQAYNAISDSTTATYASTDNDLYVEHILEVGGQLYVNGQEIVPIVQYWQENSNVLSPANSTWDLAVGGTATSSAVAKIFAVGNNAGYFQGYGATLSAQLAHRSPLTIHAAASQTENLSAWKNSSGTNLVVIDENGLLGLGVDNPSYALDISNSADILARLTSTDTTAQLQISDDIDDAYFGTSNGTAYFGLTSGASANNLNISSTGNVGIGVISPGAQLDVRLDSASEIGQIIRGAGSQTAHLSAWQNSSGTNLAYVDASGNIAVAQYIGTPADDNLLQLASNLLTINGDLTTTSDIAVNGGDITSSGNLRITPTGTLTLNSTGNTTIDSSGDIILDAGGADIILRDDAVIFATLSNLSTDLFIDVVGDDLIIPDRVMIGQSSAGTSLLTVQGAAIGKALAIFDETGDQNILSASASGTTVAYLDRTGNLFIEGALADLSGSILAINDDLRVQGNDIYDSAGVAITFDGSQNITTYGTLTLPNSNTLTGVANFLQVSNGISVGGGTTYYVNASGHANFNNITGSGLLTMNNAGTHRIAGTLSLDGGTLTRSAGGLRITTTSSGNISATSAAEITFRDVRQDYAIPLSLTDTNLDSFDVGDRAIIDALNYLRANISGGGGGGGGFTYWTRTSEGLLYPTQTYESIAVGGTSTASAKFHVNAITGNISLANGVVLNNQTSNTLQLTASTAFDLDTALIDLSTQTVDVTLNSAVDALNFGSNLLSLDASNSRIGIGTAAPNRKLEINSSSDGVVARFTNTTSGQNGVEFSNGVNIWEIGQDADEDFRIRDTTGGTTPFLIENGATTDSIRVTSAGNVGINTSAANHKLEVAGGYAGNALVALNDTFGNDIFTASSSGTTRFTIAANGLITLANGATIDNTTNGTLAFTEPTIQLIGSTSIDIDAPIIDLSSQTVDVSLASAVDALNFASNLLSLDTSNNYIGIGTAAPNAKLHIVEGSGGAKILAGDYGTNTAFGAIGFGTSLTSSNFSLAGNGSSTYLNTPNGGNIHFQENGNTVMLLNGDGFLRIGNSSAPTARLSLYQDPGKTVQENGIAWSNDTNLFRASANVLKTEDRFVSAVGIVIDADGDALPTDVELYVDGDISLSQLLRLGNYAGDPGSNIGSGSLAYDSSDNVVKYFDGSNWQVLAGESTSNWYFNETDATIYPRNVHSDLLIGGASTASAKFHVNSTTGDLTARAATFSSSVVASGQIRVGQFGSDPTAIGSGSLYFNSSDNQMYLFDGTQWSALSSASGGVWYLDTADGVIRPSNINPDILLGGYSTDSAKLRFSQSDGSIYLGEQKHRIYEAEEPVTGNKNLQITSTGDYLYVEPDLRVQGGDIYKEYQGDVIITMDEDFNETRFTGLVNATDNLKVYTIGSQRGDIYTQNTGSMNKIWTTSDDFNAVGTTFQSGLENPAFNDELKLSGTSGSLTQTWTSTADFQAGSKTSGIENPTQNNEIALQATNSAWIYRPWPYRKSFNVTYTGGSTLSEYQVLLDNIDTASLISAGKMKSDCSDMRFGDDASNELSFYVIYNTCNTADTEVWVQTSSFNSSGETVYMYYGNSNAANASDIASTFDYDTARTVGYVVHDNLAAQSIDVMSLSNNNVITIGSGSVSLDAGSRQSITSGNFTIASPVTAKGLFMADADAAGTDMIVPVSFAGKEFAYRDQSGNVNTICLLSPWGTANYTIYDDGAVGVSGSVGSSGSCFDYDYPGTASNARISSDIPILAFTDDASSYPMVLKPLVKNEYLYGIGGQWLEITTGPEGSVSNTTENDSTGASRTFSIAANSIDHTTGHGTYGTAPSHRIISTDASISAQQFLDGDDLDSTIFYDRKELSTVYGSANGADYIGITSPYPNTSCSLTQGSSTVSTSTGGASSIVNWQGHGTGNTNLHVTDGWTLTCDKPVMAHYQLVDTNEEHNLLGYVQMRQFTYPTPTTGSAGTEEHIFFDTGDETWTSATYDAGAAGNFLPTNLLINWVLDGSDNVAPKFRILGSNTGAFAGEESVYPAAGQYYQSGGSYNITNGVSKDITGEVSTAHRYWRVVTVLNTGSYDADTPTVQDISLIGSASFLPGERSWTSNYVISGSGHQSQNLSFGQPNKFKARWALDGSDNIAPKFQIQVSTTTNFSSPVTLPNGAGTYYQDGGTYDLNNNEAYDITAHVAAIAGSMNNWNNSKYYWRVIAYLDTGTTRTDTPIIYDIQLQNHRPLVLQQYGHDVGIGITNTQATLHVEATNSADVFKLTDEGEQLLKVDINGNVEFGSSTNNDVRLTVYGDIFSPDQTNIKTNVGTILGSYLYDTTRDRDGGAWRKSSIAKTFSWYREGKDDGLGRSCVITTDDRCGTNHFPAKANIVWTADSVYIFDVSTNTMWMKFNQASGAGLGIAANNTPSSVVARDGRVFIGMNGTSTETGIYEIDFTTDTMAYWNKTARSESTLDISKRNSTNNVYSQNTRTMFALPNTKINDLDLTLHGGNRFLSAASDGGVMVISLDQKLEYEYRHQASALNSGDTITSDGNDANPLADAFDFNEATWIRSDAADNVFVVTYQFATAKAIQRYGIRPRDDFANTEAPEDWVLEASNNGTTWTTLETVTDANFRDLGAIPNTRWKDINPTGATYTHYRINVSDPVNAVADQVLISDIFYQTRHEKSAVKLYGSDFMKAKPRMSSSFNTTTLSFRHLNDWRRTNNNGEVISHSNADTNGWVQISLQQPVVATQYSLTRSDDTNAYPVSWDLYGSNDSVSWIKLDTRSSQTIGQYEYKAYTFTNSTAYQHYRIDILANAGDAQFYDISDFQIGGPVITASSSNNNTTQDETNLIFDDSETSTYYWLSAANCSGGTCNEWVRYDYGATTKRIFNSYAVKGYVTAGRQIQGWTLEACGDVTEDCGAASGNWDVLHTKANTGNPFTDTGDILNYTFSNSTAYQHYRLKVTANGGNAFLDLRGFWMLGAEDRMFANSNFNDSANSVYYTIDRGDHGSWNSQAENSGDGFYIEKHFPHDVAQTISGVSWAGTADIDVRGPRDITVSGSNDRITWTQLAQRDGMGQIESIHFANDTAFKFYRFTIDANYSDANYARVDELYFVGGRYHNVRFSGSTLVATNGSRGTVDIWNNIWDNNTLDVEGDDILEQSDQVIATANVSLDSTPNTQNQAVYSSLLPHLTGVPEYNTKYALEVDGSEIYFSHRNGTDRIELVTSPDPDGYDSGAKINASFNTTYNVINEFDLDHFYPMEESTHSTQLTDYGVRGANSFHFFFNDSDGNPQSTPSGRLGRGYAFTSSEGDTITIPDINVSELDRFNSQDFAVGGWVFLNTGNTANRGIMGTYLSYGCGAGTCLDGWYLNVRNDSSNGLQFVGCPNTEGGACTSNDFQTQLPYQTWTHVVVQVRNGTGELYINGEQRETFSIPTITDGGNLLFGTIGSSGTVHYMDGRLDELFINYTALEPLHIRKMYEKAAGTDTVTADDADIASSTTIGKTTLSMQGNRYRGTIVEITGGTGSGQTRLITKNSATTLTVSPAWSTLPDSTSDFRVRPWALPGSTNQTKASRPEQKDIFLGLNNGSNGGGVIRLDRKTGYVTDYYHGEAGKTDDAGNAWGTTSGYDNVVAIETTQDNLIISTDTLYWREKIGDTLFEAIDKLQQAMSGTLFNTHTQNATGADSRNYTTQVMRKGWSWMENNDTTRDIYYGISYNTPPLVFISAAGTIAGTDTGTPTSLRDCSTIVNNNNIFSSNIRRHKFTATESITNPQTCFTWLSIGDYDASLPEGSFAGGADLAEWYGTDDTSLKAGEIVSVAPEGDIKVVRSDRPQDPKAIGIIATQPAITLGDSSGLTPGYKNDPQLTRGAKTAVQVALAGRVPLRVSLENGPILPGDYLTTGSKPGVAVKAIKAGPTIGKALEGFDGSSTIIGLASANATRSAQLKSLTAQMATGSATVNVNGDNETAPGLLAELERNSYEELNNGIGTIMTFVNTSYFDPQYDQSSISAGKPAGNGTFAIDGNGKLIGLGAYSFDIVDTVRNAYQKPLNLALGEFGELPNEAAVSSKSAQLADRESVLDAALARLKTLGTLALSELNVANARVLNTLFARKIETDELASQLTRTNLIKPLEDADVIVEIGQEGASESGQFAIFNKAGEQLATIDNSGLRTKKAVINDLENRFITVSDLLSVTGNASVSGELTAQSARINQLHSKDATISGTLYANNIRGNISSENVSGLEARVRDIVSRERAQIASSSASSPEESSVRSLITQLLEEYSTTKTAAETKTDSFGSIELNTPSSPPTSLANAMIISQDVAIDGIITAQSLALNSALSIGTTTLSAQEFAFSGDAFSFQSNGIGKLSFLADALVISQNGGVEINTDLRVNGRATFTNDLTSEKSLFATLLQPLPNNNLEVQLASANTLNTLEGADTNITPSEFVVRGQDNQEIAAFSASGSSRFRRLVIASEEAKNDSGKTEVATSVVTNATTGTGTIPAGQTKFIVRNTTLSNNSLIYLTPTSSTKNKVMYIGAKAGENPETEENEGYFEVVLDGAINEDVSFNWWIIN